MKWTEGGIARAIALQTFNRKYLVVVPNCMWTGSERDLLVVTDNLRLIDVEIKISRADFKADAKKSKWWHREFVGYGPREEQFKDGRLVAVHERPIYKDTPLPWPPKVWKHYYALPAEIWKDEMFDFINPNSGVLLLKTQDSQRVPYVACVARPAKPNRDAEKISPAAAIDIARLASLRMWNSFEQIEKMTEQSA